MTVLGPIPGKTNIYGQDYPSEEHIGIGLRTVFHTKYVQVYVNYDESVENIILAGLREFYRIELITIKPFKFSCSFLMFKGVLLEFSKTFKSAELDGDKMNVAYYDHQSVISLLGCKSQNATNTLNQVDSLIESMLKRETRLITLEECQSIQTNLDRMIFDLNELDNKPKEKFERLLESIKFLKRTIKGYQDRIFLADQIDRINRILSDTLLSFPIDLISIVKAYASPIKQLGTVDELQRIQAETERLGLETVTLR